MTYSTHVKQRTIMRITDTLCRKGVSTATGMTLPHQEDVAVLAEIAKDYAELAAEERLAAEMYAKQVGANPTWGWKGEIL